MSLHKAFEAEAESKEKHGVWDPYAGAELTITSPYVHSRVDYKTFTHTLDIGQPYARVDFIPQSGTFDMQNN
jgi:hypothetical protein